jgi:hypothetical protein
MPPQLATAQTMRMPGLNIGPTTLTVIRVLVGHHVPWRADQGGGLNTVDRLL